MTEELCIWSVNEAGTVNSLSPLKQMQTEWGFEELLVRNPEMLEPGLRLVGRQTPTQTGWLDLLAVDTDGRLVVYELKRGMLTREAVAQVLDYASDLDAMSTENLAEHISQRSGSDGIERIDNFEQWYADNFDADDLSLLLPPRMVLVGLGVDAVAERMAAFISAGPVDISVVTFHGFQREGERLLARQLQVESGRTGLSRQRRYTPVAEKRRLLQEYLDSRGYKALFGRVFTDIRRLLPKQGILEQLGKRSVGFRLSEPGYPKVWKTYFGVQAGYMAEGVYSVSVLEQAISWGGNDAFARLRKSVDLTEWSHGGYVLSFKTPEEWDEIQPHMLEFVQTVLANRTSVEGTET